MSAQQMRLERVRDTLERVRAFTVDAETRQAAVEGLAELKAAIAHEAKLDAFTTPEHFDFERFAEDLLTSPKRRMAVVQ